MLLPLIFAGGTISQDHTSLVVSNVIGDGDGNNDPDTDNEGNDWCGGAGCGYGGLYRGAGCGYGLGYDSHGRVLSYNDSETLVIRYQGI